MYGNDRRSMRKRFVETWAKVQARAPLEPLEAIIAEVIETHPEYHALLAGEDAALDRDWMPERGEVNPFLHMGLHVAIREQIAADRPAGVRAAYTALLRRHGTSLAAEHTMVECLATALWEAGRTGTAPDEVAYLDCLRR